MSSPGTSKNGAYPLSDEEPNQPPTTHGEGREQASCPVIVRGPSGDASCNCVLPAGHPVPHECACGVTDALDPDPRIAAMAEGADERRQQPATRDEILDLWNRATEECCASGRCEVCAPGGFGGSRYWS